MPAAVLFVGPNREGAKPAACATAEPVVSLAAEVLTAAPNRADAEDFRKASLAGGR